MKRVFTLLFIVISVICSASAELAQLDDGYYRIQCVETGRYISFRNNYVDTESFLRTTESQFWPLRTISGFENVVNDPGSVIYLKKHEQGWTLCSQDYDFDFYGSFFQITDMGDGSYSLWATYSKSGVTVTRYMRDCDDSSGGFSYVTTQEDISKGWNWRLIPVNSDDQKYIGLLPEVKVGGKGYATFYAGIPYKLGSGMKAYVVDSKTDATCTLMDIGSTIPAKTPVVIECAGDNAADNKLTPLETSSGSAGANYLKGVMFCYPVLRVTHDEQVIEERDNPYWKTVDHDVLTMRVLGEEDGKLVFKKGSEDLDYMPANKAYLSVPLSAAATLSTAPSGNTIHVETAGTLSSLISDENKFNITDLTITGRLNGTDFRLLRAMAGNDYQGHPTEGKLEKLDLSGATIVAGGNYAEFENNLCNLGDERTVSAYISEFIDNSLPECLFLGCSKLQEIKLPSSIVAIHTGAFRHTGLTSFVVPKSTETLKTHLFTGCDNLISLDVESGNTTYWAKDNAIIETSTNRLVVACKNTTIPSEVLIIGQNAFYNSGETIVLPANLNKIERSAFSGTSLKSINIPASVSEIEGGAFASCDDLIDITVNEGNTKYKSPEGSNAIIEKTTKTLVAGCQSTVIPLDVTAIGAGAFLNNINKSFISIALPASITSIGSEAFYSCAGLTSINLPSTLETIGDNAFAECSNLTSVTIGAETPLVITADVFTNRANATLYVPAGSKAAYQAANYWKEFKEIVEVEAPSGNIVFASDKVKAACVERWDTDKDGELSYDEAAAVTSLVNFSAGDSEFSFDEFQYFTGVTSLGNNSFSNRENLTSIILPSSITSIGSEAFWGSKITSINLGDLSNLTTIGTQAFYKCYRLTEVTLPASITNMGSSIFADCYNIVKVVSNIAVPLPNSGENSIIDIGNDAVLYVPEGTADVYKAAGWKESFFDIQSFRVITEGNSTDPVAREGLVYGGSDIWMGGNTQGQRLIYPGAYRDGMMEYSLDGSTYSTSVPTGKEAGEYTVYYRKVGESVTSTPPLTVTIALSGNIVFANDNVKAACVAKWDTNKDGELSYEEAAAVTSLVDKNDADDPFAQLWELGTGDSDFSFDEFQYFTGVTSLAGHEFECDNLTSIILPNSITSIGNGTFYLCKKLTSIHIPASVTDIYMGENDFTTPAFNSEYLQTITVDSENTKYASPAGSNAIIDNETNALILGCGNTDFTKIPNTVTTIGQEAFAGVTFANTIVSLPTSVKAIKSYAFEYSNITSINLGELSNLTTIGTQAFSDCKGLTEVTLPASISQCQMNEDEEGIGISVFANCYNLVKVVSNIEEPFNNDNHYYSTYYYIFTIYNDAVLYVPKGTVQNYIDKGWKEIDGELQSFRVITDGDYTPPVAREGLVYGDDDIWMDSNKGQRLIYPGAYRDGMMEYSLDGTTYNTSVPTGKEAGEYTVYYRKVGESDASILKVTIAAPKTISVFSGSNLWAGYVATENLAIPTGLEAYVITNLGATTATASSLNYIPQGVPVLLKRNNASVNDYEISTGTGTAPTVNLLRAYDYDKSVSNREGFILYNDEFVLVNEGTLPAGRVFLPANGSGRALTRTIVFDRDDIVDFGDSQENNDDSNQWYDIQGRKLERKPTKKGIYILDGRKVVIK